MKYVNKLCADVGTANCPCPLAETGDCLICGRLSGKDCSDCKWSGVCIYNEYIQNDKIIRNRRKNFRASIVEKREYENGVGVMALKVPRGFALEASFPGSFIFLNGDDRSEFSNVPISVMRSDIEKGMVHIAFKIISAKTKLLSKVQGSIMLRGVYRNGLLGKGLPGMERDVTAKSGRPARWLIITKGLGFAPAVNILNWAGGRAVSKILMDDEKAEGSVIEDCFLEAGLNFDEAVSYDEKELTQEEKNRADRTIKIEKTPLWNIAGAAGDMQEGRVRIKIGQFDRVFILASDYYIASLKSKLDIPDDKLVFSNNFHMCCGEGICGACSHAEGAGDSRKMCKCRYADISELL